MATRKKAVVPTPPVEEAPPQNGKAPPNVLPDLVPGTMTPNGFVPVGNIEWVDCTLWPDVKLRVGIDTSTAWGITQGNYTGTGDTGWEREAKRAAAFIAGFEGFNFADRFTGEPIPVPDPTKPETFMPLVKWDGQLTRLYLWIMRVGVTLACNKAMGNS